VGPDIEALLVAYLTDRTGTRTVTDLPADLDEILPVYRVACAGGGDDGFRLDRSIVDLDSFAATRAAAAAKADEARELLLTDLHTVPQPTGVVTGVRTITKPRWVPDPNPNLRRFTASYAVYAHT
jgi:hypothetical protein